MTNEITHIPPRDALPWRVEPGAINLPDTYLIHCKYGPIAIVQESPRISIGDFEKNMETLQEALNCLELCRRLWGDGWQDELKGRIDAAPGPHR